MTLSPSIQSCAWNAPRSLVRIPTPMPAVLASRISVLAAARTSTSSASGRYMAAISSLTPPGCPRRDANSAARFAQ